MTEWEIRAKQYGNCNCSYGCPCQFAAPPTYGNCEAAEGFDIEEGHFGDTRLDGLRAAALYKFPGAIHEGGGTMQLVIDERADAEQRDALERILTGEDTEEAATFWWVYAAMSPNKLPTLYKPIELEVDVDARRGRLVVPGVVESVGEPIRSPVSGKEHRARIDLPNGLEFRVAEIGSGSTTTSGAIELEFTDSYGQFANLHLSHAGVVA